MTTTDTMLRSSYGSPRLQRSNPYERFPERDSWTDWEVWQRTDGSQYVRKCAAYRWGEVTTYEDWRMEEVA